MFQSYIQTALFCYNLALSMTCRSFCKYPNGQVAQSVEQRIENPRVGSSILPLATKYKRPTLL